MGKPLYHSHSDSQKHPSGRDSNYEGILAKIPLDVIWIVFSYLPLKDLQNVYCVNWSWYFYLENNQFWKNIFNKYIVDLPNPVPNCWKCQLRDQIEFQWNDQIRTTKNIILRDKGKTASFSDDCDSGWQTVRLGKKAFFGGSRKFCFQIFGGEWSTYVLLGVCQENWFTLQPNNLPTTHHAFPGSGSGNGVSFANNSVGFYGSMKHQEFIGLSLELDQPLKKITFFRDEKCGDHSISWAPANPEFGIIVVVCLLNGSSITLVNDFGLDPPRDGPL